MNESIELTCASMALESPRSIEQELSPYPPLTLKSGTSPLLLAKNTSNSVLNWNSFDFLAVKSKSFSSLLSPLKASHLRCMVLIWRKW